MKAVPVYPGHVLWPVWCNHKYDEYNCKGNKIWKGLP